MSNKYREFEIDLTTSNDCEFVLDVVNNNDVLVELFANEYDGGEHFSAVIYVGDANINDFIANNKIFENIDYDEYELDKESIVTLSETRDATIDDLNTLNTVYKQLEQLFERYSIISN